MHSNGKDGIALSYSNGTVVSYNSIVSNAYNGIYLSSAGYNTISFNSIASNKNYGLTMSTNTNYNTVHHNNFDHNAASVSRKQGIDVSGKNFWNSTEKTEGNYWADWQPPGHPDNDGDGIVDTPYVIDGSMGAKDKYPLTNAVVPEQVSPAGLILAAILITGIAATAARELRRTG